jgi:hypothetical protein
VTGLAVAFRLWSFALGDNEEAESLRGADEAFFLQDGHRLVYRRARDAEFLGDGTLGRHGAPCGQVTGQDALANLGGDLLGDRYLAVPVDDHLTRVDNP